MKKIFTIFSLCFFYASLFAQPGALDKTFANGGKFLNTNPPANTIFGSVNKVLVQPDGKILLAGYGQDLNAGYSGNDFAVMRLNADGTIDNSFSNDGIAFVDFSGIDFTSDDYANDIALQTDGKIILTGVAFHYIYDQSTDTYNYYDIAIARLNDDGSPDNSFNGNGKKTIDMSPLDGSATGFTKFNYDFANACVVNPDGRIDIAGQTNVYDANGFTSYDAVAVQLNADGSFDNSFDGDGIRITNIPGSDEIINDVTVDASKKILLGGWVYSYNTGFDDLLLERLNSDGSADNNFANSGTAIIDGGYTSEYGYSLAIQTDNKIVLGGSFHDNFNGISITRLNPDGSFDNSFSNDGIQTYYQPNEDNSAGIGLAIQTDGKIIVAGSNLKYTNTAAYEGSSNYEIIRYNTDGTIDPGFGNYGISIVDFGSWTDGVNDYCGSCLLQNDGKLIAVGYTAGYIDNNNYSGGSVARILTVGAGVSISAPPDQNVQAADGECGVVVNNIDPVLDPSNSTANVNYELYGATKGTGTGSLSGTQFNIGTTTAIYSLADNSLNRAIFNVTVNGGNNSAGGALDFDGVDDRVNLGTLYTYYSGQYSFEAWIKVRAYTNNDGLGSWLFGNERNGNGGIQVQLDGDGYISTFYPSVGFVKSTYKVPLDAWTHIAFVQSSSDLKLYVNGDFVQTLLTAPNLHNTYLYNEPFLLGAFSSDFVNYTRQFNGEMDEVRFWNKAICQAQIQNNLHCEISGYADGLVAYYKMNQGIAGCSNLETAYLNGEPGYGTLENFTLSGPGSNWVAGYITGSCAPFSPLSIVCPNAISVDVDPGQCGAIVNFKADVVAGCSPNVTVSYSQDPGTYFNSGTTYVYIYAYDDQGNYANCSFPVTVTEHEPPVLITKNITLPLGMFGDATISQYDVVESLTDNCGIDPWNVYLFPTYFNCSNTGDNKVTITATDHSGNTTTQYATVTITPFVTTSKLEVNPSPVQYSDLVTFKATIPGGYMFSSCLNSPEVTFKLGDQVLGTVPLAPDYYGNYFDLTATLDKQILPSDPGTTSRKVTAIFGGTSNGSIIYDKQVYAKLNVRKEDAGIEYTASQVLTTACSTCINASVPFTAVITDTADLYRGDIHNASATVTIIPVTAGASVIGDNTITVPALTLVNNKNTSALLKGKFNVSIGSTKKARFDVSIQVGNYYTGKLKVPVFITRGNGAALDEFTSTSPNSKKSNIITGFDVMAMPNPTHDQFSIKVQSSNNYEKINLRIMDIAGRIIESKTAISVNETIQLGHEYKPGTYMVEISQGQNRKLIKLVKL